MKSLIINAALFCLLFSPEGNCGDDGEKDENFLKKIVKNISTGPSAPVAALAEQTYDRIEKVSKEIEEVRKKDSQPFSE